MVLSTTATEDGTDKMPREKREIDDIQVLEINDHLLAFYAGRQWTRLRAEPNWLDDGAMKLGIAAYAVYGNRQAVVYDTLADRRQAAWMRRYLENKGINRFTVVLSHWHLDHVAGNEVFQDSPIISNCLTRELLVRHKSDIEAGRAEGPPAIKPLVLPNLTFDRQADLYLDDLHLELRAVDIHSRDGTVIYIPRDRILLAGDTLEDTVTYVDEPEHLAEHVANLRELLKWPIVNILPNHGDPEVMARGGYGRTLIEATINYVVRLVNRAHDADYLGRPLADYLKAELDQGWVQYYEPYEEVHRENLKKVQACYQDKPRPVFRTGVVEAT
jgi:glyoxylase-like metal-dependent hydrolase (beta-lactamase superfamily II)